MIPRVIINGAFGKMGVQASETIQEHPDFELVARLSSKDSLQEKISELKPQIVIDLTRADVVYANALAIVEAGVHPVIGTTGLLASQIEQLQGICKEKKLGGIIAPNFSIAVILMMRFAAGAAAHMPAVEIIEAHHPQKFDAPSGTALKTAEMIAKARQASPPNRPSKELIPGVCGGQHHEVPIHSLRLPGILAEQQVIFGNLGETLTITHRSIDRKSFMPGLVLCCQKVQRIDSLFYGLEHFV